MSIIFWLFGKCCNGIYYFLCFVDCTSLYNLVNKANLLHNYSQYIYFFSVRVSATMCPSSGEITVTIRHLVYVTLCGYLSGMQGAPCIPDSHPHRLTNTMCRIVKVISPDDGHIVFRNTQRKEINILRKIVQQVGFIYKVFIIMTMNQRVPQRGISSPLEYKSSSQEEMAPSRDLTVL